MERLFNEKEAAEYLGISEQELDGLVENKRLPAYKLGGQFLRYKQADLDRVKILSAQGRLKIQRKSHSLAGMIRDYIYYNDFYIIVAILIIILLALIFKISF